MDTELIALKFYLRRKFDKDFEPIELENKVYSFYL